MERQGKAEIKMHGKRQRETEREQKRQVPGPKTQPYYQCRTNYSLYKLCEVLFEIASVTTSILLTKTFDFSKKLVREKAFYYFILKTLLYLFLSITHRSCSPPLFLFQWSNCLGVTYRFIESDGGRSYSSTNRRGGMERLRMLADNCERKDKIKNRNKTF